MNSIAVRSCGSPGCRCPATDQKKESHDEDSSQPRIDLSWIVCADRRDGDGTVLLGARANEPSQVIDITAKRFAFAPDEIHLKAGQPVTLRIVSDDVKHGLFSRPLGLDEVIPAGQPIDVKITPRRPGRYTIVCDNFCGSGHGNMKMTAVVE